MHNIPAFTRFTASECIGYTVRVRVGTPPSLCVSVSLLQDSVIYHADAVSIQSDAVNRVTRLPVV